jgi:nicotinate-nucleotide adenylyltransferase
VTDSAGHRGDRRRVRIGLLGGSFNPAHAGHRHVAEQAMAALGLHQVWLLVSPGNPLKPARGMAPFAARLASARRIADGRRVVATGIEARLGTRYTADTLALLRHRFPRARFALLLGADNLEQLPRWRRWREIARTTPIAVVPRPGATRRALAGQATRVLGRHRRRPAALLRGEEGAAHAPWCLIPGPEHPASATAIRARCGEPWQARNTKRKEAAIARTPKPRAGDDLEAAPPRTPRPRRAGTATKALSAAGPDRTSADPPRSRETEPDRLQALVAAARTSLEDDKAENIQVLDVTGRASFTDRMIIATGQVERQLQAMATHLEEALEKAGMKLRRDRIQASPDWVLIDAGDLVVHLFRPDARATYALERMWGPDSPQGEAALPPGGATAGGDGAAEGG